MTNPNINSRHYSVSRPVTLNSLPKVKCHGKGQCRFGWPRTSAIVWDRFWTNPDNFETLFCTPSFDLEFDLQDDLQINNKGHFRDQCPELDLGTQLGRDLNVPSFDLEFYPKVKFHGRGQGRVGWSRT